MKSAILCACMLAGGVLPALPAMAQEGQINDPTRPPAVLTPPVRTIDGGGMVAAPAVRREPQLQSVLVSLRPGGRRIAVIDGKMVKQGQSVGGAVVVSIGAREVVLRRGARTQTLKLYRPAARIAAVQQ